MTKISQTRLLAVSLHLREELTNSALEELLSLWERVTFKIYGLLEKDARSKVGDYVRLAWNIQNNTLSVEDIRAGISEIGHDFKISSVVEEIKGTDRYTYWTTELRYLMFRYEEHLVKSQGVTYTYKEWERIWEKSPSDSIEHIWAQSTVPDEIKHNLGNLLVLPPNLNSSLQDKDFKEKREAYRNTGLLIAQEVAKKRKWTEKSVLEREKKLLNWI